MSYKKPLLAVVVFCLIQALGGAMLIPFIKDGNTGNIPPNMFGLLLIVTNLLTISVVWGCLKMIDMKRTFSPQGLTGDICLTSLVAAAAGILAIGLAGEQVDLPNLIEDEMMGAAKAFLGIMAVGIVGPIAEELLFREGIMGHMLRSGDEPWKAILFSAFLFGAIHFNPAQVPFAFAVGIILGIIYWRTGSIVLTSVIHVINNCTSLLQVNILGEEARTFTMTEWFGGQEHAYAIMALTGLVCVLLLRRLIPGRNQE